MAQVKKLKIYNKYSSDDKYSRTEYIPVYDSVDDLRGDKYINIQLDKVSGYIPIVDESDTRFGTNLKVIYKDNKPYRIRHYYEILPNDIDYIDIKLLNTTTSDGYSASDYSIDGNCVKIDSAGDKKEINLSFAIYVKLKNGDYIWINM